MIKKNCALELSNLFSLNYLCLINGQKFFYLLLEKKLIYKKLCPLISFKKSKKKVIFSSDVLSFKSLKQKVISISYWMKKIKKNYKRLIIKGLGYRFFSNDTFILSLKIGFSHTIQINVPKTISFNILDKNNLSVFCYDFVELTTFCKKIEKLKKVNSYTGKGVLSKKNQIKIKPVKKK
jgi:hypothetical protein